MTWREDLRRVTLPDGRRVIGASFRGAPFLVRESERQGGRRAVVHEFPGSDVPYVEDLGRQARRFRVEAYVIGDDYLAQRDTLLERLEQEGVGELVHPYYGVRRAICIAVTAGETTIASGQATFTIEFQEAPAQQLTPSEDVDLVEQVDVAADAAAAATELELAETYDTAGLPSYALQSVAGELRAVGERLGRGLAGVALSTQEAARVAVELHALSSNAAVLIRQPGDALGALVGALRALGDTVAALPGPILVALKDAYRTASGVLALGDTLVRRRERDNQRALSAALRRVLAVEAARLVPRVTWVTLDEAATAAADVAELLEEQEATAGDAAYPALVELRTALRRAVPGDAVLARLVTVERRVALPSLLLSYQLYGSVDQEADIVARNRVRHPGFLAGELQVLSHG